jgi:tyrosine-protein kinase Etk/Wzc
MPATNHTTPNGYPAPQAQLDDDDLDIRELVSAILRNWYWLVLSLGLAFLAARFYMRYAVTIYQAGAKILIRDESSSSSSLSEEAILQELGITRVNNSLVNEIQILKSRTLMQEVMETLGLGVQYIGQGRLKDSELYRSSPVLLDSARWGGGKQRASLELQPRDEYTFTFFGEGEEARLHAYGQPLIVKKDTFWLSRDPAGEREGSRLRINIGQGPAPYLRKLNISIADKVSSVLEVKMEDPVAQKAADIVNTLVRVYNQAAIDDKNQVAKKTLVFVDERLRLLTQELSGVEGGLESYKARNEIPAETGPAVSMTMSEIARYDSELTQRQLKLELLRAMRELLGEDAERFDFLPANLLLDEAAGLDRQIAEYNNLLLERERLRRTAAPDNPQLRGLDQQLRGMRANIAQNMDVLGQNLQLSIRETQLKLEQLRRRLGQAPRQERELLEIKRQQNIKEALYLFLLQKREETALSAAVTTPNARVIDAALPGSPVSPKPLQVYAICLMLGMVLPIGTIMLRKLFDDKVYGEADLKGLSAAPLLGAIPRNRSGRPLVIQANSRGAVAEMFRLLRANLRYLAAGKPQQSILVTSGLGGDGKTFIALNLGVSLALAGKKTVLLGMDLRKPKLAQYLVGQPDHAGQGLSNFLVGEAEPAQLIRPSGVDARLYYLPSGPIPPNPAELLGSDKIPELFAYLRQHFDHILIDTAPVGLVADALLLEPFVDITLFIVRHGKTPQGIIRRFEQLRVEKKLTTPALVLNGVRMGKGYDYGYGYGYGYGYYVEEKKRKWWGMKLKG